MGDYENFSIRVENSFVVTVDRETLTTPNLQSYKGRGGDGGMKNKVDFSGKGITSVTYCNNGTTYVNQNIMPNITDVKFSVSGKVTIVYFADHTKEKAVLSGDDVFSVEQGISICVTKSCCPFTPTAAERLCTIRLSITPWRL